MNRIFDQTFPDRKLLSKDDFRDRLNEIIFKLDQDKDSGGNDLVSVIDLSLLNDLELSFLDLYLQVCYAEEERMYAKPYDEDDIRNTFLESLPCKVYFSEKYKALLIDTPVLIGSSRTFASRKQ